MSPQTARPDADPPPGPESTRTASTDAGNGQTVALAFVLMLLTVAALTLALVVNHPAEDDPLFNCHLDGNHRCGPSAAWHGFVNARF